MKPSKILGHNEINAFVHIFAVKVFLGGFCFEKAKLPQVMQCIAHEFIPYAAIVRATADKYKATILLEKNLVALEGLGHPIHNRSEPWM